MSKPAPPPPPFLHRGRRRRPRPQPLHAAGRRLPGRRFPEAHRRHRLDLEHGHARATCTSTSWRARPAPGADAAGGKSIIFGTITVSDGISMGTLGMRYSLVSREVIADSIETVRGRRGLRRRWSPSAAATRTCPGCVMAHGAPQPPGGLRLRRHHPAGHPSRVRRRSATSSRSSRPSASTRRASSTTQGLHDRRGLLDSRPRLLRGHVHGQHHGLGHRGAGHEPAQQLDPARRRRGEEAATAGAPARRRSPCCGPASARGTS